MECASDKFGSSWLCESRQSGSGHMFSGTAISSMRGQVHSFSRGNRATLAYEAAGQSCRTHVKSDAVDRNTDYSDNNNACRTEALAEHCLSLAKEADRERIVSSASETLQDLDAWGSFADSPPSSPPRSPPESPPVTPRAREFHSGSLLIEVWSKSAGAWMLASSVQRCDEDNDEHEPSAIFEYTVPGLGLCRKKLSLNSSCVRMEGPILSDTESEGELPERWQQSEDSDALSDGSDECDSLRDLEECDPACISVPGRNLYNVCDEGLRKTSGGQALVGRSRAGKKSRKKSTCTTARRAPGQRHDGTGKPGLGDFGIFLHPERKQLTKVPLEFDSLDHWCDVMSNNILAEYYHHILEQRYCFEGDAIAQDNELIISNPPAEGFVRQMIEVGGRKGFVISERLLDINKVAVRLKGCKPVTGRVKSLGYVGNYIDEYESFQKLKSLSPDQLPTPLQILLQPNRQLEFSGTFMPSPLNAQPNPATQSRLQALNSSQRAVVLGLRSALEVIHGPPGTGKSTTIQSIVALRCPLDRPVLVTCTRNVAVECLAGKLGCLENRPLCVFGRPDRVGVSARRMLLDVMSGRHFDLRHLHKVQASVHKVMSELDSAIRDRESACNNCRGEKVLKGFLRQRYRATYALRMYCHRLAEHCKTAVENPAWCRQELLAAKQKILKNSRIFLCTAAATKSLLREWMYAFEEEELVSVHTVVIDECGCTPESSMALLMRLQPENLILIGDHNQLPPMSRLPPHSNYVCSSLERCIKAWGAKNTMHGGCHMLREQYRMHPQIASLVSRLFYHSKLTTPADVAECEDRPLVWYNVTGNERKRTSYTNNQEARAVVDVCVRLRERDRERDRPTHPIPTIALLTFYSGQRDAIQELVPHELDVSVLTVDASQGSEFDYVVLSTVRSNAHKKIGFVQNPQRICVALSRARAKLIIVGDGSTLSTDKVWLEVQHACLPADMSEIKPERGVPQTASVSKYLQRQKKQKLLVKAAHAEQKDQRARRAVESVLLQIDELKRRKPEQELEPQGLRADAQTMRQSPLLNFYSSKYREGEVMTLPGFVHECIFGTSVYVHLASGVKVWAHAIDVSGDETEVVTLLHYSDARGFANITDASRSSAQVFASLRDECAHFGKGVYGSAKGPAEYGSKQNILWNNYNAETKEDFDRWDGFADYAVPIIAAAKDTYDVSTRSTPEMRLGAGRNRHGKPLQAGRDVWIIRLLEASGKVGAATTKIAQTLRSRVERMKVTHGLDDPETLEETLHLANILSQQCEYKKAEELQRKVLRAHGCIGTRSLRIDRASVICVTAMGDATSGRRNTIQLPCHLPVEQALRAKLGLSKTCANLGDFRQGLRLQAEILQAYARLPEVNLKQILQVKGFLAESLKHTAKNIVEFDRAETLLREVVSGCVKSLGSAHWLSVKARHQLAVLLSQRGKSAQSREEFKKAYQACRDRLGPAHSQTLQAKFTWAVEFSRATNHTKAVCLMCEVLNEQLKWLGLEHADTLMSQIGLAIELRKLKDYNRAVALLREVAAVRKSVLGCEHIDTLKTMLNLAKTLCEQGEYDESEGIMNEVFSIQKRTLGANHQHTLRTRMERATILSKKGSKKEAQDLLHVVLLDQQQALGRDHPDTKMTNRNLNFVRRFL